jgi:hypothetical protein
MKIICSSCKKTIGEKAPFKDSSEIKAKCPDCISKEREAITPFQPVPRPEDGQTVIIDTNLTGTLWVPKNQNEKISLWELGVSGKKFFCSDANKEQFQEYLESIRDEQCDVSFLHSLTCTLDKPPKRGKKKEAQSTTVPCLCLMEWPNDLKTCLKY